MDKFGKFWKRVRYYYNGSKTEAKFIFLVQKRLTIHLFGSKARIIVSKYFLGPNTCINTQFFVSTHLDTFLKGETNINFWTLPSTAVSEI